MNHHKIIIIGAGLSGLVTAYLLQKKGLAVLVLEADSRIGGRIETIFGGSGVSMEMGATWFGSEHQNLVQLLEELELPFFKQHTQGISLFETMSFVPPQKFEIPDSEVPSYRISGGTSRLTEKLTDLVSLEHIRLNTKIRGIKDFGSHLELTDAEGNTYLANQVISTLPPNLLVSTISFEPNLQESFESVARKTHTWMGESIKFSMEYSTAFWRESHYSGTVFSQASIIQEQYDHSSSDGLGFSLKGFLNGGSHTLSKAERQQKVVEQLVRMFGPAAENYIHYYEKVWRDQEFTFVPYAELVLGHENNGHPQFKNPLYSGKLFISGSETAVQHPGYMDGAIAAAKTIAAQF